MVGGMAWSQADIDGMARAQFHAVRGRGRTSPNPLVGAVVLQGDQVAGEGWHAEYGDLHAEIAAILLKSPLERDLFQEIEEDLVHDGPAAGLSPPAAEAIFASDPAGERRWGRQSAGPAGSPLPRPSSGRRGPPRYHRDG